MKKLFKLMVLITALTFCFGTMTVFAADTEEYDSIESGDINMGGDGQNDDQTGDNTGDEAADDESAAGGTASPQTSASIAPIVAVAGIAAAGAAAGLKRK